MRMKVHNEYLTKAFSLLNEKKYSAYYISVANENLYEFTREEINLVKKLTDFTGDTASLLIVKGVAYLYVDGRFTIQAKNEVKDKRIKVIEFNRTYKRLDDILKKCKSGDKLAFNSKLISIDRVLTAKEAFRKKNVKLVNADFFGNLYTQNPEEFIKYKQ